MIIYQSPKLVFWANPGAFLKRSCEPKIPFKGGLNLKGTNLGNKMGFKPLWALRVVIFGDFLYNFSQLLPLKPPGEIYLRHIFGGTGAGILFWAKKRGV